LRGEIQVRSEFEALAKSNQAAELTCFAGFGAYDHYVPPAVDALASRAEFVTSYTPYQPEVAQGVLQALFEFQSLVARLSCLDVANASLYDGAHALTEAVHMLALPDPSRLVYLSEGIHPHYRQMVEAVAASSGIEVLTIPLRKGRTSWPADARQASAVAFASPNYLGLLEDPGAAASFATATGAALVQVFNPMAASVIKPPGEVGAAVGVAEGQPLGIPLSFGGPYLGLFACRRQFVRSMPGRLVGMTTDSLGRTAFTTTLRTREQDIRREKASSNICTNQTLLAIRAAVYLSLVGPKGLRAAAVSSMRKARQLAELVARVEGVSMYDDGPFFNEFPLKVGRDPSLVIERMAEEGILAGVALNEPEPLLLVAVTEKRTPQELERYAEALERALK
jgi:glycine dehydrogenase subunit 1